MNNYETVFILTPVLSDAQMKEAVDKFTSLLKEQGAEIVNEECWGLRKLAYPIDKKSTGFYQLVEFDAEETSFTELCKLFFEIHNPAQTDGQGPDIGPQYRSEIFYLDENQEQEAQAVIDLLRSKGHEVNTRLTPASTFWPAEDYHQHYYDKTGGEPYCHIRIRKF